MPSVSSEIFELLLAFQVRRRLLRRRYSVSSIPIARAHILLHLDTEPDANASELAAALQLDKSTLSREIAAMIVAGLLSSQADPEDRRKKKLKITTQGRAALAELDSSQEEILRECFSELSETEISLLTQFLNRAATAFGAKPLARRLTDHPATLELRRLSRGLGMLGTVTSVGEFSISDIHILVKLQSSPSGLTPKEIREAVPFEPSTLSRRLNSLETKSYISRSTYEDDARSFRLSLSEKGVTALNEYLERIRKPIEAALTAQPEQAEAVLRSLRTIANGSAASDPVFRLQPEVEIEFYSRDIERHTARAFLVEQLVRRNAHFHLSSELLPEKHLLAALLIQKKLHGLCEVQCEEDALTIRQCLLPLEKVDAKLLQEFLLRVFRKALTHSKARKLIIPAESDATQVLSAESALNLAPELEFIFQASSEKTRR